MCDPASRRFAYSLGAMLLLVATGCGSREQSTSSAANPQILHEIQKIVAEHLHKPVEALSPNDTFASLGADDLDLVEITMAVEEHLGIAISDDALTKAAGTAPGESLTGHLTLRTFVTVADVAPKQSSPSVGNSGVAKAGTLRKAQVGVYGELSSMRNPNGYELVFVPTLESLTAQSEQRLGREMDQSERDALKLRAAVIALPPAEAEEMKRKRAESESRSAR